MTHMISVTNHDSRQWYDIIHFEYKPPLEAYRALEQPPLDQVTFDYTLEAQDSIDMIKSRA